MSSTDHIEIYIAFGYPKDKDPFHWLIIARPFNSPRCTYYHSAGGPIYEKPYELSIQENKRIDSTGLSAKHLICIVNAEDLRKLKAAAQSVRPQYCQAWVVHVLRLLEREGTIMAGIAAGWQDKIEHNPHAGLPFSTPSPVFGKMVRLRNMKKRIYSWLISKIESDGTTRRI